MHYSLRMGVSRCRVSFTDIEGLPLCGSSGRTLYEAGALAVAEFSTDNLTSEPGPMTEFTLAIQRPVVEHNIKLGQVLNWPSAP